MTNGTADGTRGNTVDLAPPPDPARVAAFLGSLVMLSFSATLSIARIYSGADFAPTPSEAASTLAPVLGIHVLALSAMVAQLVALGLLLAFPGRMRLFGFLAWTLIGGLAFL